jgi:hypothetical protein
MGYMLCSTQWKNNANTILVWKPEGRTIGPKDNIKPNLKEAGHAGANGILVPKGWNEQTVRLVFRFIFMSMGHQQAYYSSRRWRMSVESHGGMILTGKPTNTKKNLSQCHFIHHKSHVNEFGYRPMRLLWEAGA